MKLFEHADTGFIFLTNLSLKFGDPQLSHSCKRNQKEKHFYYLLGCHIYESIGLPISGTDASLTTLSVSLGIRASRSHPNRTPVPLYKATLTIGHHHQSCLLAKPSASVAGL